ncbi:MAG: hypothetical protein JXA73_05480 [Acidobacteria bacterium]|nr:hypothetical protein [Acidobacteriota bacterium]
MLRMLPVFFVCFSAVLHAQDADSNIRIRVKIAHGYMAVDEIVNEPKEAFSGFRDPIAARRILLDDMNRAFRALGRVYCAALTTIPCPDELPSWATGNQSWESYRTAFETFQANHPEDLKPLDDILTGDFLFSGLRLIDRETGLFWDTEQEMNSDWERGETDFVILPPTGNWVFGTVESGSGDPVIERIDGSQGPPVATDKELLAILAPWQDRVWQASVIKTQVDQLYDSHRVIKEGSFFTIEVSGAAESPRFIKINEGARLAEVTALPAYPLPSSIVLHQTLPDRDYRRLNGETKISYPFGMRPVLTYERLAANSALWGLSYDLQQFIEESPNGRLESKAMVFDRIDPNGSLDPKPQYSLGGGFVWRPEQGFHLKGRGMERGLMRNSGGFSAEAGGANAGPMGKMQWSSDYVFFGKLRRRLQLHANGYTDIQSRRIIGGQLLDERRWTAQAGFDFEWFRDRDGADLSTNVQARWSSVFLTAQDDATSRTNLAVFDIAAGYRWGNRRLRWGRNFAADLRLSAAPGVFNRPRYTTAVVAFSFAQRMPHRFEYHTSAQLGQATRGTPPVELLSMGSEETVRGFRSDEALARRLAAWQNELWIPLPMPAVKPYRPRSKLAGYIHENILLAVFGDFGGAWQTVSGVPGIRSGAGAGIRWRIQRLISLKLDYGFGFGPGPTLGRFYLGADIATR